MKKINLLILLTLVVSNLLVASEKKVLVEIMTNSHCPLCPAAHSTMDNYLQTVNANNIENIYYHISRPYPSDQLYQNSKTDSDAKYSFYGLNLSSPIAFFNGTKVSNSYSNWAGSLDDLVLEESQFDILLSGNYTENDFVISSEVTQTGAIATSEITINYVVVEKEIDYQGNNGLRNHKNVMRKIVNPHGEPFTINLNETKTHSATIENNSDWSMNKIKVIVFLQNKNTKEVYQSASISYTDLTITDVDNSQNILNNFELKQNYPNPFNPTTTIQYSIPDFSTSGTNQLPFIQLKVYDILGKEVATLINNEQNSGSHQISFDASQLSAGFYYYQLRIKNYNLQRSNEFTATKKMILLK